MEQIGIEKEIDKVGRILIPKHIRKSLGFDANKSVEMIITEDGLLIRSPKYKIVKNETK